MSGNDVEDDGPPGMGPPPTMDNLVEGMQSSLKLGDSKADATNATKEEKKVEDDGTRDEPDPSLKSPGLQESAQEVKTVTQENTIYTSAKAFEDLGLSKELLDGLYINMRFEKPSKIQATTLPMILSPPYKHLIAQAHNGSGKTTCFVLAMLQRCQPNLDEPQALLVCPTRELVVQNYEVMKNMGEFTKIQILTTLQTNEELADRLGESKRIKHQVVVGTHGRLKSYINKRWLPLTHLSILVFDEADQMLDQENFKLESERLLSQIKRATNNRVQVLLFSATFSDVVRQYAQRIAPNGNHVLLPKEELSLDVIKQYRVEVPSEDHKFKLIDEIIFPACDKMGYTIVFVRTREKALTLKTKLEKSGHSVTQISGKLDPEERDRVTREFRKGTTRILISTDLLARGFDVSSVTLVVNYDMPVEKSGWQPAFETYLHRIGRSGRFGRKGVAFNLCNGVKEEEIMNQIEEYFDKKIPKVEINDEGAFVEVLKQAGLSSGVEDDLG